VRKNKSLAFKSNKAFIHFGQNRQCVEIDHLVLKLGVFEHKWSATHAVNDLNAPISQKGGDYFFSHQARRPCNQHRSTAFYCQICLLLSTT
jgi:hypothetical protein